MESKPTFQMRAIRLAVVLILSVFAACASPKARFSQTDLPSPWQKKVTYAGVVDSENTSNVVLVYGAHRLDVFDAGYSQTLIFRLPLITASGRVQIPEEAQGCVVRQLMRGREFWFEESFGDLRYEVGSRILALDGTITVRDSRPPGIEMTILFDKMKFVRNRRLSRDSRLMTFINSCAELNEQLTEEATGTEPSPVR